MLKPLDASQDSGRGPEVPPPGKTAWTAGNLLCEYLPPVAAAVSGTVTFGSSVSKLGVSRSLALAGLAGSAVRTGSKAVLEHLLLEEKDRTLSSSDITQGALDGLAGVTGSLVERELSALLCFRLGQSHGFSSAAASLAGEQILGQSIASRLRHNFFRGTAGGAAASLTDTLPKSIYHNQDLLAKDFSAGVSQINREVFQTTLLGAGFGGLLSGGATGLWNLPAAAKLVKHQLSPAENNLRVRLVHINDWHSELSGSRSLARGVTINNELRDLSQKQGISHISMSCGDEYSGNAAAAYTKGGKVENDILAKHFKIDNRLDGNHQFDTNRGDYDLPRHFNNMSQLRAENPNLRILGANLDHSAYPEYKKLVDPYRIHTVNGPQGPEKLGIIGLSTHEGAQGKIGYLDPQTTALKYIHELNQKGVKHIGLMTHLGFSEDLKLAKFLAEKLPLEKRPKFILGGHSHDFTAVPHLEQGIPIAHAGSNGRYVGELDLSIRPDGTIDLARTQGRMHHLRNSVAPDAAAEAELRPHLQNFHELGKQEYNVSLEGNYSIANIRSQETALGNLTSDATMYGVRELKPDLVINHSGGIRAGLQSNEPVTRRELSNIFINSGIRELEKGELVLCRMTGRQIREAIEFGLQDLVMPGIERPKLSTQIINSLRRPPTLTHADKPGNFCQISGGAYSFDLSKPPRVPGDESTGRLVSMSIKSPLDGSLTPLNDDTVYKVVTRYHPLDKWHQHGVLGDVSRENLYRQVQATTIGKSQVDLLGDYINGRVLNPQTFSGVDGRIQDLTPYATQNQLYPGWSSVATPAKVSSSRQPENDNTSLTGKLDKEI